MTLLSRISGLVRDVVMANILGAGSLSDTFFVAFRIPNFLRRIFGEGAFSQAFIPVFSELTERNTEEARRFVNATTGVLAVATLLLSTLGIVFAPEIVVLFTPGFADEPLKVAHTVEALRIMFPYLFCISLVAMSAGILNTTNRFAVPAATPVILNLCMILALLVLVPLLQDATKALAIGVLIAGVVQLLFQLPSLRAAGYLPRPVLTLKNASTHRVFTLMLPAIFSVSVAQINTIINTILASFLAAGSISWLYYSERLMEFPVAVFGIALATVVLPSLSKEHKSGSAEGFATMLDWALRWVILIATPATFALYVLATPLLTTIFQYNQFTIESVQMSALSLQAYAVGVSGFIFVKVLAPGFFARQDTKTPMKIAIVSVLSNVVLSLSLVGTYKHTGLALAISLAAWVNASLLFSVLWWRGIYRPQSGWLGFILRVGLAVTVMVVAIQALNSAPEVWYARDLLTRFAHLVLLVGVGAVSYFATLFLTGVRPRQLLLAPTSTKP
ncbi:putative peptidoglycan lipid II flippase [Arenicella xantha]|uniref:Probable lipid II flippase MurJ n=2 Tax=Arenicella xantha TaxID=644221 RepID=A0A395JQF1_9GAMM|nr:putative peptidoglycan lipid II flippase [Arenicella xantha]